MDNGKEKNNKLNFLWPKTAHLGPPFGPKIAPKYFMWVPFLRPFPGNHPNEAYKLFFWGPKWGVLGGGQKVYVQKVYVLSLFPMDEGRKDRVVKRGACDCRDRCISTNARSMSITKDSSRLRCFFAPPSMRNRRSQFSAYFTGFPPILVDLESISADFLSIFNQFQSILTSFNQFQFDSVKNSLTRSKTQELIDNRKVGKTTLNSPVQEHA